MMQKADAHGICVTMTSQTKCPGSAANTPRRGDLLRRSQMQNNKPALSESSNSHGQRNPQKKIAAKPRKATRRGYYHGLSKTAEYRAWMSMKSRCTVVTDPAYPNYGGRGITVCDRWLNDVRAFYEDMGPKPTPAHELDRIDNDGPYSPENCRWTTREANLRNKRSNRLITHNGATRTLIEWSEATGLKESTITRRLKAGWDVDRALTTSAERPPLMPPPQCKDCGERVSSRRSMRCRPCSTIARYGRKPENTEEI